VQLIALSIFAISVFNRTNLINLFFNANTGIILTSPDGITTDERDFFLNHLTQEGIYVARVNNSALLSYNIYTSNPAINARLPVNGRIQTSLGTNLVISSIQHLIFDFHQRINISVFDISCFTHTDGLYFVSTTDPIEITNLLGVLSDNQIGAMIFSINDDPVRDIFLVVAFRLFSDIAVLHIFIFLCVLILLIQYAINQLRYSTILLLHGYSNLRLSKNVTLNLVKLFMIPCLVSIAVFFTYGLFVIGYSTIFMLQLSFFFLIACLALVCVYIIIIHIVIYMCLKSFHSNSILKGKKPFYFVQVSNHIFRALFFVFLFTILNQVIIDIESARSRLAMQSDWDRTRHIYRMISSPAFGNFLPDNLEREFDIFDNLILLHEYLSENHNSFIMDSTSHFSREFWGDTYVHITPGLDFDVAMNIRVSPNYFNFNPIFSVTGLPVENELIFDDYVLNIIVPISRSPHHDIILYAYLNTFYFNKVRVDNIYNREFGLPLNTTSIDELTVNIIYAKDNQTYFTLNTWSRLEENINIVDPIVIVYTGSEHPSFLMSNLMTSYFIVSETSNPLDEVAPVFERYDLVRGLPWFESIYEDNATVVLSLYGDYIKNVAFLILIIMMSIVITYILMQSHIEKNRYVIYVKMLFGYGFWRRNKNFIVAIFIYNAMVSTILIVWLGFAAVPLLLCFYTLDILIYAFVERIAVSNSFSNIVKQEH